MYGVSIAFRDYNIFKGFSDAPWVGLDIFRKLFASPAFIRALKNTVIISFTKLLFGFPSPIILSLLINEVVHAKLKKAIQTSVLLPSFISWIIIGGLMFSILSPNSGLIKYAADILGYQGKIINIMGSKEHFRKVIIASHVWKGMGMGTIVYLAAIAAIDPQLYEAAIIDGAGKMQQVWHITLATIRPTIVILLIFRVGALLDAGFEQIFAIYNPLVYEVSEIIDTYVYKTGIIQQNFSLATAAGVFKSLIGLVLVLITNFTAKKIDEDSGIM